MLKATPETPQHNGITERMNTAMNKRAKNMQLHAGLPKMSLAESVNTEA